MAIREQLEPLKATTTFPYLGRTVMYNNSNWEALYSKVRKAQQRWGIVTKVMWNTGAPIKSRSVMYKVVVQAVLLYRSEIWLIMDNMVTVLESFHNRTARCIVGVMLWRGDGGKW